MPLYNPHNTVKFTWRMRQEVNEILHLICDHRGISMNNLCDAMVSEFIKHLVANGMLPAALEARTGIPTSVVTARILTRVEQAEDAAKELRFMAESGLIATWDIYQSVKQMINSEVREAVDIDIEKNGPVMYHKPGDPDCLTIEEAEKRGLIKPQAASTIASTTANESNDPPIDPQSLSQPGNNTPIPTGAFLDEVDATLASDLEEATAIMEKKKA